MNPALLCMYCMGYKGAAEICPSCRQRENAMPDNQMRLPPRTVLAGRYYLGHVLGQGGFGITYLAWDLNSKEGRKLAIKEHFPQFLCGRSRDGYTVTTSSGNRQTFAHGLERFEQEADALKRFLDHPGIVTILDFVRANGTAYIVMEYVEGETFEHYLAERGGRIEFSLALRILVHVMDALRKVHKAKLLHRDVSPANIYINDKRQVTLLDFGSAREAMREELQNFTIAVKRGYTAREQQIPGEGPQDSWTDVYAVAATLYRAIVGRPPSDRLSNDALELPSRMDVAIPPAAEAALVKALAVRWDQRFATIEEFQRAITPRVSPPPPMPDRPVVQPPVQLPRPIPPVVDLPGHPKPLVEPEVPPPQPVKEVQPPEPPLGGHVATLRPAVISVVMVILAGVLISLMWTTGAKPSRPVIIERPPIPGGASGGTNSGQTGPTEPPHNVVADQVTALVMRGNAALASRDYQTAIGYFQSCTQLDKNRQECRDGLSAANDRSEKDRVDELAKQGNAALAASNYALGIERFETCLRLDPSRQECRSRIEEARNRMRQDEVGELVKSGNTAVTSGDYPQAFEQYQRCLSLDPNRQECRAGIERARNAMRPTVTLSAASRSIRRGEAVTISWKATGASDVTIEGVGPVRAEGSMSLTPKTDAMYALVAVGRFETVRSSPVLVRVLVPPTLTLRVSSTSVQQGQMVTISWDTTDADELDISPLGRVTLNGTRTVTLERNTEFVGAARGSGGTAGDRVEVVVVKRPVDEKTFRIGHEWRGGHNVYHWLTVLDGGIRYDEKDGRGNVMDKISLSASCSQIEKNVTSNKWHEIRLQGEKRVLKLEENARQVEEAIAKACDAGR